MTLKQNLLDPILESESPCLKAFTMSKECCHFFVLYLFITIFFCLKFDSTFILVLKQADPKPLKCEGRSCLPNDPKIVICICLAHSGFVSRCCPKADSQLTLELFSQCFNCWAYFQLGHPGGQRRSIVRTRSAFSFLVIRRKLSEARYYL